MRADRKIHVERGSGNVFTDLGRPDADTHVLKAELVARIDEIVRQRGLTQAQAAKRLSPCAKGSRATAARRAGVRPGGSNSRARRIRRH